MSTSSDQSHSPCASSLALCSCYPSVRRTSGLIRCCRRHYQIYSATRGDNDENQDDLVNRLLPILKKHKVDLYICGHDHNLQILKPQEGVHFVVAGGGGAGTYELDEDYTRSVFKAQTHGFAVIEVDDDSLDVRLIDVSGKELSVLPLKKEVTVQPRR
jgi:hypothetical protein